MRLDIHRLAHEFRGAAEVVVRPRYILVHEPDDTWPGAQLETASPGSVPQIWLRFR